MLLRHQKSELLRVIVAGNARLMRECENMFATSQAQYFQAMDLYVDRLGAYQIAPSVETSNASTKAFELFIGARLQMEYQERALAIASGRWRHARSVLVSFIESQHSF